MIPRASIIIPAFNEESTIEASVRSVVRQTETSLEIIVVDDGSSDRTPSIVATMANSEPRLKLVVQTRNSGPGAARNRGIELARGRWIGFLDAGDWIEPQRIAELIGYGEREDVEVVYDNQFFTVGGPAGAWRTLFPVPASPVQGLSAAAMVRNDSVGRVGNFGLLKPVIERDFLARERVRFPEALRLGEDFCFHLRCYAAGASAVLVSKPSYHYLTGGRSLSARHEPASLEAMLEEYRALERTFEAQDDQDVVHALEHKIAETAKFIEYKKFLKSLRGMSLFAAAGGLLGHPVIARILLRRILSFCETNIRMSFVRRWQPVALRDGKARPTGKGVTSQ